MSAKALRQSNSKPSSAGSGSFLTLPLRRCFIALVNNLLSAIGASPFFNRPNFPQKSRYYPPGIRLALLPFGQDALQHFLYLERPEGMDLEDSPELEVLATPKPSIPLKLDDDQVVPLEQDFATVGHLY